MAFVKRFTLTRDNTDISWDTQLAPVLFSEEEEANQRAMLTNNGGTDGGWTVADDYTMIRELSFETEQQLRDYEVALDTLYDAKADDPRGAFLTNVTAHGFDFTLSTHETS
jgi:hypothetical protein